jgi:O-antigen ligase
LGFDGQQISGISNTYASQFSSWAFPESVTAHNFGLQIIIETGYLGLTMVIIIISIMLSSLGSCSIKTNDKTVKILFFILTYLMFTGITESVFTLGHPETQSIFMLIFAATGVLNYAGNETGSGNVSIDSV